MRPSAILIALLLSSAAAAQQRSLYDAAGRPAGHAATDTQGTTTYYGAAGNVTSRTSTSANVTTIYDAAGRRTGTVATPRPERTERR